MDYVLKNYLLFVLVTLSPAILLIVLCKARWQRSISIWLTASYIAFSAICILLRFTIGRIVGSPRLPQDELQDTLVVLLPVCFVGCIWLMHLTKMHIARRFGWWGAAKVGETQKCYGFPVIPKKEDEPRPE